MPSNRVELAMYICEVGSDLIKLAKANNLDATAHCLELAVICAVEAAKKPKGVKPAGNIKADSGRTESLSPEAT